MTEKPRVRTRAARLHSTVCPSNLSKDNLEELKSLPFSRNVWVKRRVFDPGAILCRRSRIEHLEWIPAVDCLGDYARYLRAL